jgi:cytochrome c oxidase subunit II
VSTAPLAVGACAGVQSALDARGPGAERIIELWWLLLGAAAAVYAVVVALLLGAVVRRGRGGGTPDGGEYREGAEVADRRAARRLIAGATALPAVILAAVFAATLRTQAALHGDATADLTVRVIGRQWWWEVRYPGPSPGDQVVTANEIHIPTGQRVRLELTSLDVIHSLWVPSLQGKTDLVPGRTTVTWLQADLPGTSRGQCAEYCGLQHTQMALLVIAEPPAEFARWLDEQRRPAEAPADTTSQRGQAVFLSSGCGYCHAVRGTRTLGLLGPDLTHFASRRTIAAGTLANIRGNLAGWIADPQHIKPGNKMPRVPLMPEDLHAVVRYLEGLR